MSADFVVRLIGMIVFSIVGVFLGNWLGRFNNELQLVYTISIGLVGALFGLVLTPYLTTRPMRWLRNILGRFGWDHHHAH